MSLRFQRCCQTLASQILQRKWTEPETLALHSEIALLVHVIFEKAEANS